MRSKFSVLLFSSFWMLTFSYDFIIIIGPIKQVWKISKDMDVTEISYIPDSEFEQENTYMILRKEYGKSHIIYWVGKNSELKQRTMTASYVGLLKDAVNKSFPQNLISITRETYNKNANTFQSLLELTPLEIPRLYRIMYTYKRKIVQVPMDLNEINNWNSFLLVNESTITVFHGMNVDNYRKQKPVLYAKYILTSDEKKNHILIIDHEMKNIYKILDPRSEEKDLHVACSVKTKKTTDSKDITEERLENFVEIDYTTVIERKKRRKWFQSQFRFFFKTIAKLSQNDTDTEENSNEDKSEHKQSSEEEKYTVKKQFSETEIVVMEEEMVKIRLYEFRHKSDRDMPFFIRKRPIYLKHNSNIDEEKEFYLKSDQTYFLKEMYSGNIYIYFGKDATIAQIQDVMEFAETSAVINESHKDAWKLITVVQEGTPAPFHFRINFRDGENYISSFFKH